VRFKQATICKKTTGSSEWSCSGKDQSSQR